MDRLFLDANVLFSAAYRPRSGLIKLWRLRGVHLCSSRYAMEEARINLTQESQMRRLDALSRKIWFEGVARLLPDGISLPLKDIPILLAAIEANATRLITGDIRHFGDYMGKRIENVLIILPGDYLRSRERD